MATLSNYQEFLENSRIPLRLACKTESGWPMILSLWFVYSDGSLYCATRGSARIVKYLLNNKECAFEIAADTPPYCGIRGQAQARIDHQRGVEILEQLLDRYIGSRDNILAEKLLKNSIDEVAIRLDPVNIFSWDFSERMQDTSSQMELLNTKICP